MKCTRACKECKGESCSNATDLVELTENADEDESFDYISEIELEKRNAKRLAYERFKRSIFGLEDTDSEEEEGEEDQIEDHAVEETVEVSRTSNVDEPSTSQILYALTVKDKNKENKCNRINFIIIQAP
ncbi:hypothetical protein JTB14_013167 [Gonioctena quinquepunctata]|nr:hypothetical protein JTB14_013167 [Gonioctena quinquepunctata]